MLEEHQRQLDMQEIKLEQEIKYLSEFGRKFALKNEQ